MTLTNTAIRSVIREVIEGTGGHVRTVPMQRFGYGTFRGQPDAAVQALSQDSAYTHRFDVLTPRTRPHKATPASIKASHRMVVLDVEIGIWTGLDSSGDDAARDAQRDAVAEDAERVIQALMYPGNLAQTHGGNPTRIVSGMCHGEAGPPSAPRWEVVDEDWRLQLMRSRILATAIVTISQPVS